MDVSTLAKLIVQTYILLNSMCHLLLQQGHVWSVTIHLPSQLSDPLFSDELVEWIQVFQYSFQRFIYS